MDDTRWEGAWKIYGCRGTEMSYGSCRVGWGSGRCTDIGDLVGVMGDTGQDGGPGRRTQDAI